MIGCMYILNSLRHTHTYTHTHTHTHTHIHKHKWDIHRNKHGLNVFLYFQFDLINMAEVDAILISNYHCMLALPYLTEYTNFKGVIYATDPTLYIGR